MRTNMLPIVAALATPISRPLTDNEQYAQAGYFELCHEDRAGNDVNTPFAIGEQAISER